MNQIGKLRYTHLQMTETLNRRTSQQQCLRGGLPGLGEQCIQLGCNCSAKGKARQGPRMTLKLGEMGIKLGDQGMHVMGFSPGRIKATCRLADATKIGAQCQYTQIATGTPDCA